MKLNTRFLQLPIQFDAARLAQEIGAFDAAAWRPHPAGYEGNDFLPLISAHGDPANESFNGPMRPTPHLSTSRPYLLEVLGSLGAVLGRTRLMRLSGNAEVSEHVDVNYYWRGRMRVHVPIVTQPVVNFICGDQNVHMAAGECWVFDTWSLHRVTNHQTESRTHLVVDTVGGEGMLRLLQAGRVPGVEMPGWMTRPPSARGPLEFESVNMPVVMSPWEMREHIQFLLSEVAPGQAIVGDVGRVSSVFLHRWGALWSQFGEAEAGFDRYRAALAQYLGDLKVLQAGDLMLVNEVDFLEAFTGIVVGAAVSPRRARQASDAA